MFWIDIKYNFPNDYGFIVTLKIAIFLDSWKV